MATLTDLTPNGDGTISASIDNETDRTTPYYTHIDEGSASAGSDMVTNDQSEVDGNYFVELTSVDADFGSMSGLKIVASTHATDDGSSNDALDLYAQVFLANETTALTDEIIIADETFTTKGVNTDTWVLNATGLATSASGWNGARVRFRWDYQKTGAGDNNQIALFAFELTGTYIVDAGSISGSLSKTLDDATLSSTAELDIEATLASTLGDATLVATAELDIAGSVTATLADATLASTAELDIAGSLVVTLADATLAGVAELDIAATLSKTLDDATLVATGTVGAAPPISGTLTATLGDATLAGTAELDIAGTVAVTLDNATLVSTAELDIAATLSGTLGDATLVATGELDIAASVAPGQLADATLVGLGELDISASLVATLADATLVGVGELDIDATFSGSLADATLIATGTVATAQQITAHAVSVAIETSITHTGSIDEGLSQSLGIETTVS